MIGHTVRTAAQQHWDTLKNGELLTAAGRESWLEQVGGELPLHQPHGDLRFGTGPDNRVFLLNKQDGTIREVVR